MMKPLSFLAVVLPLAKAIPSLVIDNAAVCKLIPGDAGYPSEAEWKQALPKARARGAQKAITRPDYRLPCKSVDDVINGVKFAAKYNIRLSAIHSGHDGLGRNDAPSGLILGLEGLTGWRIEPTFTPRKEGVPKLQPAAKMAGMAGMKRKAHGPDGDEPMAPTPPKAIAPPSAAPAPVHGKLPYAVTFGAGMTTQQLNNRIASSGTFTMGAEHGEVGVAGGWTQCGGTGPMTSAYGLGADNVLEFHVVTADGELKVANAVANPDLYWALKGGCGSTFGIVTQATVRTYPDTKFTVTKFTLNATTPDGIIDPMAYIHSVMPELSSKGVQGYYNVFPGRFVGTFHTVGRLANEASSKKIWEPVFTKLQSFVSLDKSTIKAQYIDYPTYKAYYDATWGAEEAEMHMMRKRDLDRPIFNWWTGETESPRQRLTKRHGPGEKNMESQSSGKGPGDGRLLDKETLESPKLAAALREVMPAKGMIRGALVGGGNVLKKPVESTSLHPSWRKFYVGFWSDKDVDALAKLAPGMGAYINEASWNETNWQEVFWGSNYPKLSQIKDKYDPNMLFYVTPGINADRMDANEKGALCKVPASAKSLNPPMGDNKNLKKAKGGH